MAHSIKTRIGRDRPSEKLKRVDAASVDPTSVDSAQTTSYWALTRRPIPSLSVVLPLLLLYEFGVTWVGGGTGRAGADAWMRHLLAGAGLSEPWILPAAVVAGLFGWQAVAKERIGFPAWSPAAMILESCVLAVGLVGLSKLVDIGFDRMEGFRLLQVSSVAGASMLVGFLGAGIYEESVFRLAMIPLLHGSSRLLQVPNLGANVLAVTISSLLFSLAHHAGSPGEIFTWYVFIFRWLAGIYFAWVFVVRGFGVAVGTHAAYDILVGYFDWSF